MAGLPFSQQGRYAILELLEQKTPYVCLHINFLELSCVIAYCLLDIAQLLAKHGLMRIFFVLPTLDQLHQVVQMVLTAR